MGAVTVEVDCGPGNENWYCPFLSETLRGRCDFERSKDIEVKKLALLPNAIKAVPGQRLVLDPEKRLGLVLEPLREERHQTLVERIARRLYGGQKVELKLPEARKEVPLKGENDVATWAYWLKRGVQSGCLKVVEGELPAVQGKPRKNFLLPENYESANERTQQREAEASLLRRQELAAKLALMTPAQRKEYDRLLEETK
jgi:hypothetical protein